jgi:Cu/Ag efflux pump CusA
VWTYHLAWLIAELVKLLVPVSTQLVAQGPAQISTPALTTAALALHHHAQVLHQLAVMEHVLILATVSLIVVLAIIPHAGEQPQPAAAESARIWQQARLIAASAQDL